MRRDPLSPASTGRLVGNARIDGVYGGEVESGGTRLLNASTDDLLGLGTDLRVREAFSAELRRSGLGPVARSRAQDALEQRVVSLQSASGCRVVGNLEAIFGSWAGLPLVGHLRSRRALPHCRLVGTPEEAEGMLGEEGAVMVLDAVHQTEGDIELLPRYAEVCQRRGAALVVIDDTLGILGPTGGGAIEHLSLLGQVDLLLLPLGRAVPGVGVLAVAAPEVLELLDSATALPAAPLAAGLRALEISANEPVRRGRLFDVAQRLMEAFHALGFDTGPCVTPMIPLWLGDEALCEAWLAALAEGGIFCRGLLAGPRSRLLIAPPATATDAQCGSVIEAFERLSRRLTVPQLSSRPTDPPQLARPGTYAMAAPAALHWLTVDRPSLATASEVTRPPPRSSEQGLSLSDRVYEAVEGATWRVASVGGAQLRRGADALRALVDRRRR